MRKVVAISALSVFAAGSAAIGVQQMRSPHEAMTADLERDLSLATSVQSKRTGVVSAIEQGGNGGPSGNQAGVRALVQAQKRAPTAAPSPTVTEVAAAPAVVAPEPAPTVPVEVASATVSAAPSSSSTAVDTYPPDLSYPTPTATGGPSSGGSSTGDRGSSDIGTGDDRRGRNSRGNDVPAPGYPPGERLPAGMGTGVIGAILRGGTAGHDNCEPGGRRRGGAPGETGILGTLGTVGGIIAAGGGIPAGSIPGGPRSGGGNRRW